MADVAIIGDGLIGLSTAVALGRAGAAVHVIGAAREGIASEAAAGLLSPSVGRLADDVRPFFYQSLDAYPDFVARLTEYDRSLAIVPELIEILGDGDAASGSERSGHADQRLSSAQVAALEPAIKAPHGAMLHAHDGAIDNVRLVAALRRAAESSPAITFTRGDAVVGVDFGGTYPIALTESGQRIEGAILVLAAGAWSAGIKGLPRALPVSPLKGQMLSVASTAITRPVMSSEVYLVPRGEEVVIGATVERAGFDLTISADAIETLRAAAIDACPLLSSAAVRRRWAGIRPATPDMLPIIGPDPDEPRLLYACGHSKNGILLAPATAAAILSLAAQMEPAVDLTPFSVSRFRS